MNELLININSRFASFQKDANLQLEKGNKSAGQRARKEALEIGKLLKDFRKKSIELDK